jgi:hypothetical protein
MNANQNRDLGMKPPASGEKHREIARLALENARSIASDVRLLLHAGGSPARALALSVIGSEEAGKALLHSFAACHLADSVVQSFDHSRWKSPLSNHLFKQLTVVMIGGADAELDSYEMAAAGELGPYPEYERTARIVCACARTLSDMFEDEKGVNAGRVWFNRMKSAFPRLRYMSPYESPDDEKMRGLYVDLDRPSGQPQGVRRHEAEMSCISLEGALAVLAPLAECLEDDAAWAELIEEIGRIRDEYPRTP